MALRARDRFLVRSGSFLGDHPWWTGLITAAVFAGVAAPFVDWETVLAGVIVFSSVLPVLLIVLERFSPWAPTSPDNSPLEAFVAAVLRRDDGSGD